MVGLPASDSYGGEASRIRFDEADFAAYLDRIGFSGSVAPDIATLRSFQSRQLAAIAFENIDPLLGRTPDLSPRGLMAKLVRGGRGGYCYEQNSLLLGMLQHAGFDAHGLLARVHWTVPATIVQPRSHMLIHVSLPDGPYIVDSGFGGMTPTGPLRIVTDLVQETPHEPFRLLDNDGLWMLQAQVAGDWHDVYRFDLNPQLPIDYQASNYYLANSAESFFTTKLVAARHVPGQRLALGNRAFTIYRTGKRPEQRMLADANAVCAVLEQEFGIRLDERQALIARMAAIGL